MGRVFRANSLVCVRLGKQVRAVARRAGRVLPNQAPVSGSKASTLPAWLTPCPPAPTSAYAGVMLPMFVPLLLSGCAQRAAKGGFGDVIKPCVGACVNDTCTLPEDVLVCQTCKTGEGFFFYDPNLSLNQSTPLGPLPRMTVSFFGGEVEAFTFTTLTLSLSVALQAFSFITFGICPHSARSIRFLPLKLPGPCHALPGPCHGFSAPCHAFLAPPHAFLAPPHAFPGPPHGPKTRGLGGIVSSQPTVFWGFIFGV